MDVCTPIVGLGPHPGYENDLAVACAFSWQRCLDQPPGFVNCPQGAGVGGVKRGIGHKGRAVAR